MSNSNQTEQLWNEMHEQLLAFIRGRIGSADDAEDILQDVFTRIHKKLDTLADDQSINAWMFQIARNAITDYHRGRALAARMMIRLAEDVLDAEDEIVNDPTAQAGIDFTRCVQSLLNVLPGKYRQALELTDLGEMTQKDAAEQLGLSVSGMKTRVQRGRGKLKEVLLDCCRVQFQAWRRADYRQREGIDCENCDCD
ncbi:MAG TPA: sigma-70 family RNA polymerase sigma factor [Phycisphaerae bacterium]|nr:sigma-70 family RNA polymerase sigma factor [Phycisphaerae bacterium]